MTSQWARKHSANLVLGPLCIAILCCILVAGLWPFHAPKNTVNWLNNKNGLHLGDYGTLFSSGTFAPSHSDDDSSCSLELWMEPGLVPDNNTLLAFYTPENTFGLSLHQSGAELLLQKGSPKDEHFVVDNVFREKTPVFLTITSGAQKTAVFANGVLLYQSQRFLISSSDLTGQLIISNSPLVNDTWIGELRGLAIYYRQLTPTQVLHHYETWVNKGRPHLVDTEGTAALYLFDEHAGNVIHNQVSSGVDLYIPERFAVLHQIMLEPFSKEYWDSWKNVALNIIGFVPLGFFFCAYFVSVLRIHRGPAITIILGFLVSLSIEILQAYLPTRDSGTNDLITNTLGTCIGVVLFETTRGIFQNLLARASLFCAL